VVVCVVLPFFSCRAFSAVLRSNVGKHRAVLRREKLANISFRRCPFATPRFVYQVPFEVKFGASFYTNSIKLIMYAFT